MLQLVAREHQVGASNGSDKEGMEAFSIDYMQACLQSLRLHRRHV
jgi:hypothetical protein